MKHLFIPYPLAVIAKEKGFDENCLAWYHKYKIDDKPTDILIRYLDWKKQPAYSKKDESVIPAPLYQQIIDWFEEKHGLIISTDQTIGSSRWRYTGWNDEKFKGEWLDVPSSKWKYKTKYEALNKAIEEAFKFI